ncbi:hypothetical protein D3C75_491400 [compost metagenome]
MPGLRRHLFQLADHPTTVVDFNLLVTGLAVEDVFVIALNAEFANIMGCRIVG